MAIEASRHGTKRFSEKINRVLELARGRYWRLKDSHLTEKLKAKEKIALWRAIVPSEACLRTRLRHLIRNRRRFRLTGGKIV
jgi:hypothetical protein